MSTVPVIHLDGAWSIRGSDGRAIPIRLGGKPVTAFNAGWSPVFLFTGLAPTYLLELTDTAGARATWFLDESLNRIGGSVHELPEQMRASIGAGYRVLRDALWTHLLLRETPACPPEAEGLDAINPASLAGIDWLGGSAGDAEFSWRDANLCNNCDVIPAPGYDGAPVAVSVAHLHEVIALDIQRKYLHALRAGGLGFPSLIDGAPLTEVHTIMLDALHVLHRVVDRRHRLVYFVCCAGHLLATVGVLIPTLGLGFFSSPRQEHFARTTLNRLRQATGKLLAGSAPALAAYLSRPADQFAVPLWLGGFHVGHHLWNELTGLYDMTRQVPAARLPRVILPGPPDYVEAYGAIDTLFPELAGHVLRGPPTDEAAVRFCIENGMHQFRMTGSFVAAELRDRIKAGFTTDATLGTDRDEIAGLARAGIPIVVLGFRVENRTLVDFQTFATEVIEHIAARLGRVAIVLDGHNSRGDGSHYESYSEQRASEAPTTVELRIAEALTRRFAQTGVVIVSNIGRPIPACLLWVTSAAFFVAPWGAGLAKFRWIANLNGLIVAGRWVLQHKGDLHIYDDPTFMESPSKVTFLDPAFATDHPEAPVLVPVGNPNPQSNGNYSVDMNECRRLIDGIIHQCGLTIPTQPGQDARSAA